MIEFNNDVYFNSPFLRSDFMVSRSGHILRVGKHRNYLVSEYLNGPYLYAGIVNENGKKKSVRVNRLICKTFKPIDDHATMEVNHKDLDKLNNHVDNLEWVTRVENVVHALGNGVKFGGEGGERHGGSKLSIEDTNRILSMNGVYPQWQIGEIFGISQAQVSRIVNGKRRSVETGIGIK